jgi:FG-GAP-like repeat
MRLPGSISDRATRGSLISWLAALALVAASPTSCGRNTANTTNTANTASARPAAPAAPDTCTAPPFTTPVYVRPPDDGVALASLVEGAAYGSSTNSDWVDVAAGNLCGGSEKELVLIKNAHSQFSIMRGPTPFAVQAGDFVSNPRHPWRAVAAGNLDADAFDEIVAVRSVTTSGVADLVVTKADAACSLTTVLAQKTIGNPGNSNWLDVAIGNFDGQGKKIALLKKDHSNFFLVKLSGRTLDVVFISDLDTDTRFPWKAIAASDLDGDGIDELVAAREVNDGVGATVIAFKFTGGTFRAFATSTFGNSGNSNWAGMTAGDFNGDKRGAVVLTKNAHSNFAVLDLPPTGGSTLRVVATSDLDTAGGQDWRALTSTDWIGNGDRGAAELIAVRAAKEPFRADLFVYGNAFHRVSRDSGLAGAKAQWDGGPNQTVAIGWLRDTHTNTMNWTPFTVLGDYVNFVQFLEATKNTCIDGQHLRVWATLEPQKSGNGCSHIQDADKALTSWIELDDFHKGPDGQPDLCTDFLGWGTTFGRLAQRYPHLVAVAIDDYMNHPDDPDGEMLAEMQSRMRSRAPWLNLLAETYSSNVGDVPDIARTVDNLWFFFRNDKRNVVLPGPIVLPPCIGNGCGEQSVWFAPKEIAEVASFLPSGRKLQFGTYWTRLNLNPPQEGTPRYDYDLVRLALNLPQVGGVTAYSITLPDGGECNESNFVQRKFCALGKVFSQPPLNVTDSDLTPRSGARAAAGDPFGYVYSTHGVENVVYRATDNHAHELWRTSNDTGHSDLSALAGAPAVQGDVRAYVFDPADTQNVTYRGTDNHVHVLFWTIGAVGHDNVTRLAGAPLAAGAPSPWVFPPAGTQNVLYRGIDRHLHALFWSFGAVGHDDLTKLSGAPPPIGDPFAYVFDARGVQNALYVGGVGNPQFAIRHLHGLFWSFGPVGDDDLTNLSGGSTPSELGTPMAYVAKTDGLQHAIYVGGDSHVHELFWSTGAVGHDDLTNDSHAPLPVAGATPAAYFVASDGTQHVVYRDSMNHIRDLWWTVGAVTDDDLTAAASAPNAVGNPSAYIGLDKKQHVIYRTNDGHLHELLH